jgi:hypothetical protein
MNRSKRTDKQNASLHLFFEQVAQALNEQGYDVRIVTQVIAEKGVDFLWSKELVKEILWRNIQKKYLGKKSTTELDSVGDITEIYEMLNKFLGENFQVHVPFPSIETLDDKN